MQKDRKRDRHKLPGQFVEAVRASYEMLFIRSLRELFPRHTALRFFAPALLALLVACREDPAPSSAQLSGTIAGYVVLNDSNRIRLAEGAGVTVSLDGTSFLGISDSRGFWTLSNVPAGIYNVDFSKAEFFRRKRYSIQFVGGGTLYLDDTYMGEIPRTPIIGFLGTTFDSNNTIVFQGQLSSPTTIEKSVVILFSKSPITTSSVFTYLFHARYSVLPLSSNFQFTHYFYSYEYTQYGLQTGDSVYAVSFTASQWWEVYNPAIRSYEFNNPSAMFSDVIKVAVP